MPKSKPTRAQAKRDHYTPPARPRPKSSPPWVKYIGLGAPGLGIVLVLLAYLVPGFPGGNLTLVTGFALMLAGLVALTSWR